MTEDATVPASPPPVALARSRELTQFHAGVVELADANKQYLGHFPRQALLELLGEDKGIIAYSGDRLAGYVLFRMVQKRQEICIVHFCVHLDFRGRAVAKRLLQELSRNFPKLRGLALRCRRDFPANLVWPKLGFVALHDRPGRSNDGKLLTDWFLSHGHRDLTHVISDSLRRDRPLAVIDTNILLDWFDGRDHDDSAALRADWMDDEIYLRVTDETANEIANHGDPDRREKIRRFARDWEVPVVDSRQLPDIIVSIEAVVGRAKNRQDEADQRQLARAHLAGAAFFITRDEKLRQLSEGLEPFLGFPILKPREIISRIANDALPATYEPAGLAAGDVTIRIAKFGQFQHLEAIDNPSTETARLRQAMLNRAWDDPSSGAVTVATYRGNPVAVAVVAPTRGQLSADLAAFARPGARGSTLTAEILVRTLQAAARRGTTSIALDLELCGPTVENYAEILGFYRVGTGRFKKLLFPELVNLAEVQAALGEIPVLDPSTIAWPSLIRDLPRPVFVVPIQTHWAESLFGSQQNTLLAGNELFLFENAYYKSGRPPSPPAGALILWYVSTGPGNSKSHSIKAFSTVVSTDSGSPSDIYKQNRDLGVYRFADVEAAAGKDKKVTAIRFRQTITIRRPVGLEFLRKAYLRREIAWTNMITAQEIPWPLALDIIEKGLGIDE